MDNKCAMESILEVLEFFIHSQNEVTLAQLSHIMKLPKVSVFHLVEVLEHKGYLTQDIERATIRPGEKITEHYLSSSVPVKGLNQATLKSVKNKLKSIPGGWNFSSYEFAVLSGLSRVTARRYLEFLVTEGILSKDNQYGVVGRPIHKYRVVSRNFQV